MRQHVMAANWRKRIAVMALCLLAAIPGSSQERTRRLSLNDVFELAVANNRQLRISASNISRAEAMVKDVQASRLPTIDFAASAGYMSNVGVVGLETMPSGFYAMPHFANAYGLQAALTIYSGGAIRNSIDRARLASEIAGLSFDKNRQELKLIVAGYYLDLYQLRRQETVYQDMLALSRKLLRKIADRQDAGIALKSDRIRNELIVANLELALIRVSDRRSIANRNLVEMLALPPETIITPEDSLQMPESDMVALLASDPGQLENDAVSAHPETRSAALGIAAASTNLKLSKASLYSNLSVQGSSSFNRPYIYDIPAKDIYANNNFLGLRLGYSVTGLYRTKRAVAVAREELTIASQSREVAEEVRRRDVYASYLQYREASEQLASFFKQKELADENYRRTEANYLEQLALNTDVVDANNQKLSADLQIIQGRAQQLFSYFQLLKSTGRL